MISVTVCGLVLFAVICSTQAYINMAEDTECGLGTSRDSKIVGGSEAGRGEFPFMVSLRHHVKDRHYCGGAIISKTHIITAAHCLERGLDKFVEVAMREHNVLSPEKGLDSYRLRPTKVFVHSNFDAIRLNNDLALIKVREGLIQWDNFTSPVCLADPSGVDETVGTVATVVGWGRLSEGGKKADVLQKVEVPILENSVCRSKVKKWFDIHSGQVCAGYDLGAKDACQGDSGGPMVVRKNGRLILIGIVSAGIGCAKPNLPGVYTRVSHYMDWIKQQVNS
ncbi:unnamed protein product [Notodromas monacha]|uniref:Peptidase S1 domain-containing protein n=1 Tax=Notodromas monacha TaxID=399045 RepID=A0A7R9BMY7_9CRUS|nr:unnamed protein product [Notodromas monacha]CAG0918153.1 unnamed protein product [Notodromas monacha]